MGDPFVLGGSPAEIRASAAGWSSFAGATSTAAADIRRLDATEFAGDEGDLYRERMDADLPPRLETTAQAWTLVAGALSGYADRLEEFQGRLTGLVADRDAQQALVGAAEADVASATAADSAAAAADAADPPGSDAPYVSGTPAATADLESSRAVLQQTIDAANGVQAEHSLAVQTCVSEIRKAQDLRFEEPPGWFESLCDSVSDWVRERIDAIKGLSSLLKTISGIAGVLALIPIFTPIAGPIALATGAAAVAMDVGVKVTTGEGSWSQIGLDALGLVPGVRAAKAVMAADVAVTGYQVATGEASLADLAMVVGLGALGARGGSKAGGTGGSGAAKSGGPRATSGGAGAGSAPAGSAPAGSAAAGGRAGDAGLGSASTRMPLRGRTCASDPIDVVTGEMVMHHVDLELPSVLPLVLVRTHLSSYRWGGGFGQSWASTLDQRLLPQPGDDMVLLTEDGSALLFEGAAALPASGVVVARWGSRRWELRRDGTGWQVLDPVEYITRWFGENLLLHAITDVVGNRIDFRRTSAGLVYEISHSGGYQVLVASAHGRYEWIGLIDPDSPGGMVDVVRFQHVAEGVSGIVNSSGLPLKLSYDAACRVTGWEDRNGVWYAYVYDEESRCVRTSGREQLLSYGFSYGLGRTTVTDSTGAVSLHEYNEDGQVVRTVDPIGRTRSALYDSFDRVVTETDPLGRTVQYVRDSQGRLLERIEVDGSQVRIERDGHGRPARLTDQDGRVTTFEHDDLGNLLVETGPGDEVTRRTYRSTGVPATETDALGAVTVFDSDAAGRLTGITAPTGEVTRFELDAFGRTRRTVLPDGGAEIRSWTVEGRLAALFGPDGSVRRSRWDAEGNLVEEIDEVGAVTRWTIGMLDLPVSRTDPDGAVFRFEYDTELRLTGVVNPEGLRWSYEYDPAGQVVAETDFNGRRCTFAYDELGEPVLRRNASGQEVRFERDELGRISAKSTDQDTIRFEWNGRGDLMEAAGEHTSTLIGHDGDLAVELTDGMELLVGFDAVGAVSARRLPSGRETFWTYDPAGRVAALCTGGIDVTYSYDRAGRSIRRDFTGGLTVVDELDAVGDLVAQRAGSRDPAPGGGAAGPCGVASDVDGPVPAGSEVFRQPAFASEVPLDDGLPAGGNAEIRDLRIRRLADGTMIGSSDRSGSRSWELDPGGRVAVVGGPSGRERYGYDPSGNVVTADLDGVTERRTYDGTLLTRAGDVGYSYDADGRLISKRDVRTGESTHFVWDADDQLIRVDLPDGTSWFYSYDCMFRRRRKEHRTADGTVLEVVRFAWDEFRLMEEIREDGVTGWEYDDWTPILQHETGPGGEQLFAVLTDLAGSPTALVTVDGREVVWSSDPTLWGLSRGTGSDPSRCPLRFAGQYFDAETGLHYNLRRYYDPATGRYLSPDPLGLSPAPDPHRYVLNPTRWIDPLGLKCQSSDIVPGGGLKAHEGETPWERGHTLRWHVGKSEPELIQRMTDNPKVHKSSSFRDRRTAERLISRTLRKRKSDIDAWLASSSIDPLEIDDRSRLIIGTSIRRKGLKVTKLREYRVVLQKDATMPTGYLIKTSFPGLPKPVSTP
ncbi:hypothetical protein GIS00_01760 [Nakamurella sp. YIM 132087]|uniref:Type IV secretion protein Rhs n=1 Tax=Nakamurella alba TaxID=2665158 RepID=A0A7K1FEY6_9ACTN|nr:RNase A-like domain-containing protein [Nakamurella alba]MTD12671.1 hypothetical protein [Nakamurella alba]